MTPAPTPESNADCMIRSLQDPNDTFGHTLNRQQLVDLFQARALPNALLDSLTEINKRAEKYSEMERTARNNGDNCSMDHAAGSKHAYFEAARLIRAAIKSCE